MKRVAEIKDIKKDRIFIVDFQNENYQLFVKYNNEDLLYHIKTFRSYQSVLNYIGKEVK